MEYVDGRLWRRQSQDSTTEACFVVGEAGSSTLASPVISVTRRSKEIGKNQGVSAWGQAVEIAMKGIDEKMSE
jgi:hypothetical protein